MQRSTNIPPWQMWGVSQVVNIANLADSSGPNGSFGRKTANLINVNYARPDTWTLMLGVKIELVTGSFLGGSTPVPQFHVSVGLGLLNYQIPDAWQPQFSGVLTPGSFVEAYTTELTGLTDVTGVIPVERSRNLRELPAQSLQVIGQFDYQGIGSATVTFLAMAAPRSHVRPDWFNGHFGSELGGT